MDKELRLRRPLLGVAGNKPAWIDDQVLAALVVITVNSRAIPARRRYSVAHELGHWHHHRGQILFCGAGDIGNPARGPLDPETQADQFASDLLLPNFMFRPRIMKMKRPTLAFAREIAAEFDVSLTATLLKLADSDRFPIVLVCNNLQRRRWFHSAPMVPGWWFPTDDLDAECIAFEMLAGGSAEISYPRKIGAEAWFSFRGADRYEMHEQAFLLPNGEALTLLILPPDALE
jgi:hypothetical protein